MRIETIEISKINPAVYNPRKDLQPGDPEYEKLKKSLTEFDLVEPLIWNERTGNLVGGHQRLKILQGRGDIEVEVSVVDLPDEKEKALNLALNKISGEWDFPRLKDLLQELDIGAFDIEITGFDESEIENLMTQFHVAEEGLTDDDAIPEKVETVCKTGDLWQLGNHRLLCGDATKKEDVERLMGGEKADMVFTDPPYGQFFDMKGDTKAEYRGIFDGAAKWISVFARDNYYICCNYACIGYFAYHLEEMGLRIYDKIVWYKNLFGQGTLYHRQHEDILFVGAGDYLKDHRNDDVDVWQIDSMRDFAGSKSAKEDIGHPTQKPVALSERAITNSSKLNNIVLDIFGGSGSTLIACEKLGRRCFMMEIDEHYCDVIIQRWQNFTGQEAVKLNGN